MSIRARRRSIHRAGYVPENGPPIDPSNAIGIWWAGDITAADNANISTWNDRFNGISLIAGGENVSSYIDSTSSYPSAKYIKKSSVNDRPSVRLGTGASEYYVTKLSANLDFDSNAGCIVVVSRSTAPSTGDFRVRPFRLEQVANQSSSAYLNMTVQRPSDSTLASYVSLLSKNTTVATYNSGGFNSFLNSAWEDQITKAHIYEFSSPTHSETSKFVHRVDNYNVANWIKSSTDVPSFQNMHHLKLLTSSNFSETDICFVGVFKGPLSTAYRTRLYGWIGRHYGITYDTFESDTDFYPPKSALPNMYHMWWVESTDNVDLKSVDTSSSTINNSIYCQSYEPAKNKRSILGRRAAITNQSGYTDLSNSSMDSTNFNTTTGSVFAVIKTPDSIYNKQVIFSLIGGSSNTSSVQFGLEWQGGDDGVSQLRLESTPSTGFKSAVLGTTQLQPNTVYTVEFATNSAGTEYRLYLNGVQETLVEDTNFGPYTLAGQGRGWWFASVSTRNRVSIGNHYPDYYGFYDKFQGKIGFIGINKTPLTASEREVLNSWATAFYNRPSYPQVVEIITPYSVNHKDIPISFTTNAFDYDGTIQSYNWNFGDGTTATGSSVSKTYSNNGIYSVTVTVTDDEGLSTSYSKEVTLTTSQSPVAGFTYSGSLTYSPSNITFNASSSSDPDGHPLTGYAWNFGDGSTASGATVTHKFNTQGSYTVQLTVTDDTGLTNTTSQVLSVGPAQPPPTTPSNTGYFWWANSASDYLDQPLEVWTPTISGMSLEASSDYTYDSNNNIVLVPRNLVTNRLNGNTAVSMNPNSSYSASFGAGYYNSSARYLEYSTSISIPNYSNGSVFFLLKRGTAASLKMARLDYSENEQSIRWTPTFNFSGVCRGSVFATGFGTPVYQTGTRSLNVSTTNYALVEFRSSGTAMTLYINNVLVTTATTSGNRLLGTTWLDEVYSGSYSPYYSGAYISVANSTDASSSDTALGYVLLSSGVVSDTDRTNFINWTTSHYGITL